MATSGRVFEIPFGRKSIIADFDGGAVSSDAGALVVNRVDEMLGVTRLLSEAIQDKRMPGRVKQSQLGMIRQRLYGICLGYEDCNDHDTLRSDPVLKLAAGRGPETGADLASQPTLSRLENSVSWREVWRMSQVFVELFVARHASDPPARIIIDADATDDPCHGQQELEFFHGYFDCHCFVPLLVFASADSGEQELVGCVLRPGRVHASHRLTSVLKRLIPVLQESFPSSEIIFRGDAGMASPGVYELLEGFGVGYAISLAKNGRLLEMGASLSAEARGLYEGAQGKVRLFGELRYQAGSWVRERRVVMKAEHLDKGPNPRFVVTNLDGMPAGVLYDFYCGRGEVENRIKELKLDGFSGRTSCHRFVANQVRLLFYGASYVLLQGLRALLSGTHLARAQAGTLRVKLLKVGVRVRETTRHIWISLPTSYPYQDIWRHLVSQLHL